MKARLNVTEAERLCYSRRKLQALSALRNADLELPSTGLHKDYRALGIRGRVYLVLLPDGSVTHFQRLVDIVSYANDYQEFRQVLALLAGTEHAISWEDWQQHGFKRAKASYLATQRAQRAIPSVRWRTLFAKEASPPTAYAAPGYAPGREARCIWEAGCLYEALPGQDYCAGHRFMARQIHALTAGKD